MLGCLQGTTHPDISMLTHQCTIFNNDPKLSHERAAKKIIRYLVAEIKALSFNKDLPKGLECFVDANFTGGWKDGDSQSLESVLSRTGYVIMFVDCPISQGSKLQTEMALSTTESEYIALSTAIREVIPFMGLMQESSELF